MKPRRSTAPTLPRNTSMVLPDGRTISKGDEFHVPGEGRFRFAHEWEPDGSLAAYGPVNSERAKWRSFRPEVVKTIHRTRLHHRAKKSVA